MTRLNLLTAALAVAAALAGATSARAGLLPVSVTPIPEAGNTRFTYGIVLTTDAYIKAGDYFTIYDFAGFIPGSNVQPEGWEFLAGVGLTPPNTHPHTEAGVPNLSWEYIGTDTITGQVGLGNFSVVSNLSGTSYNSFTARTHRQVDGRIDANITDTLVPVPSITPQAPEPGTLALAGIGLPLLVFLRRRSR